MRRFLTLTLALPVVAADDTWPRWRGPLDNGVARGDAPHQWSDAKNIAWKIPIPGRGHSSPVIWGGKIFVTTAVPAVEMSAGAAGGARGPGGGARRPGGGGRGPGGGAASGVEHRFLIIAVDRQTGRLVWERTALTATPHEGYHGRYGSFASNSPVTDGRHLFAFFGSRGVYAYDLDGKLLWKKTDFPKMKMRNQFGEGSAAVLHGSVLLLNFDQEENSFLLALDKSTGKQIWKVDRDEISAWSPPFVAEHDGEKQVIISATNKVRSYDLATGKLIWECAGLGSNVIPAPVIHNGTVIVMSGHRNPNLLAIKLGKTGDLTGTDAVAWTNQRGNSYTPSPVLHDGKLYMLTDNGMLSCLNASDGKPHYLQQRLPKPYNFKASPVAVNGKLYLSSEDGDVIVVKMGEKFEVLATNTHADEMFIASPAVADGSLYLRGRNTLYCVRQ
jgi:outer membrane protein assembly factor BamB